MQREFDASNAFSLSYEGKPGSHLQRVDVGNITFSPPPSRFITPSLPSGNYGLQAVNQFGNLQVRSIFARQTGNVVQDRHYTMGARSEQPSDREIEDRQIEPRRFFFTVDPALFGRAYPNIDILNRGQLTSLRNALPDTLRPTRVLVYRLQFGAQPQNANGPRFRIQGDSGGRADLRSAARRRRLLPRSVAALDRARPAARRIQRAARRRLQRSTARSRHRVDDHRRHARRSLRPHATADREPRLGAESQPDVARVPPRDPLGLSHRGRGARSQHDARAHRHGQRAARASDRRIRRDVPPDARPLAVDEPGRVRLQQPDLAAARRRVQSRNRRHRRAQHTDGRRRASDSRPVPRLPVAASVRRARSRGRRVGGVGQSDERDPLHDAGRISVLAAASGVRLSDSPAVRDGDRRRAGLAHARRDADASRLRARRARQAGARARSRLQDRLRSRAHRLHAAGHAVPRRAAASTCATRRIRGSRPR